MENVKDADDLAMQRARELLKYKEIILMKQNLNSKLVKSHLCISIYIFCICPINLIFCTVHGNIIAVYWLCKIWKQSSNGGISWGHDIHLVWVEYSIVCPARVNFFYKDPGDFGLWVKGNVLGLLNWFWPNDVIWRHRFGSTLVKVMAYCLTVPNHYMNTCWLVISGIHLRTLS